MTVHGHAREPDGNVPAPLFDRDEVRRRIGENRALLCKLIQVFYRRSPVLLEAVRDALARRDAGQLAQHAHAYKGMVSNLSGAVARRAHSLELCARSNDFTWADTECAALEEAVASLQTELAEVDVPRPDQ